VTCGARVLISQIEEERGRKQVRQASFLGRLKRGGGGGVSCPTLKKSCTRDGEGSEKGEKERRRMRARVMGGLPKKPPVNKYPSSNVDKREGESRPSFHRRERRRSRCHSKKGRDCRSLQPFIPGTSGLRNCQKERQREKSSVDTTSNHRGLKRANKLRYSVWSGNRIKGSGQGRAAGEAKHEDASLH